MLMIKAEVLPGAALETAVGEAIILAGRMNTLVMIEFHGFEIVLRPEANADLENEIKTAIDRYYAIHPYEGPNAKNRH